ncbi:MAG: YHS domain-containing (seleno)protein [Leptolyngbyaceae cyanobacterium]
MKIQKLYQPLLLIPLASALLIGGCTSASDSVTEPTATSVETQEAQTASAYHVNLDEKGRALRGHDPVAYFTTGEPVAGSQDFAFEWDDAEYFFASAENRDEFASNPEKYAPANGGYCTFGVVLAKKFDGDPQVWLIHNDRLHVFLNQDVKAQFLQDEPGNLAKVSENWPVIQDKSPEELEAAG